MIIDFDACSTAKEDGINLFPFYATTIVVSMDNVLKQPILKMLSNQLKQEEQLSLLIINIILIVCDRKNLKTNSLQSSNVVIFPY